MYVWPDAAAVRARLGVPAGDASDDADLADALAAAIAWAADHSTVLHRWAATDPPPAETDPVPERVHRGTVDLAVFFYERRGSRATDFDGLPTGMQLHTWRLLGAGRYAYPSVGG